jgi:hypothetical protein
MGNSRFSYVSEIDEFMPRLERVQYNFSLLAAGEIKPEEMTDESVKDLATLSLLIKDLKYLKEDLQAKSNGCEECKEKDELIKILKRNSPIKFEKIKNSKS